MHEELKEIESEIIKKSEDIISRFDNKNNLVGKFFSKEKFEVNEFIYEQRILIGNVNNNIKEMEEILKLDLKEETITLKTKEYLTKIIDKAITLVQEEI